MWLSGLRTPSSIHKDLGSIPDLALWVKDLALQWLWCRPAAAAPIQHLARELPYASSEALKKKKKNLQITMLEKEWRKGYSPTLLVGM